MLSESEIDKKIEDFLDIAQMKQDGRNDIEARLLSSDIADTSSSIRQQILNEVQDLRLKFNDIQQTQDFSVITNVDEDFALRLKYSPHAKDQGGWTRHIVQNSESLQEKLRNGTLLRKAIDQLNADYNLGMVIKILDGLINHFQGSDSYSISWYQDENSAQDSVIEVSHNQYKRNLEVLSEIYSTSDLQQSLNPQLQDPDVIVRLLTNVLNGMQGYWEGKTKEDFVCAGGCRIGSLYRWYSKAA